MTWRDRGNAAKKITLSGLLCITGLGMAGCGSTGHSEANPTPTPTAMTQEKACQILRSSQDQLESDLKQAGIPLDSPEPPTQEPARSTAQQALQEYRDSWTHVRDSGPEPIATDMRKVLTAVDAMGFFTPGVERTPGPADASVMQDGYTAMLNVSSTCNNPKLFGQMTSSSR